MNSGETRQKCLKIGEVSHCLENMDEGSTWGQKILTEQRAQRKQGFVIKNSN